MPYGVLKRRREEPGSPLGDYEKLRYRQVHSGLTGGASSRAPDACKISYWSRVGTSMADHMAANNLIYI